jgi:hypothetical protein
MRDNKDRKVITGNETKESLREISVVKDWRKGNRDHFYQILWEAWEEFEYDEDLQEVRGLCIDERARESLVIDAAVRLLGKYIEFNLALLLEGEGGLWEADALEYFADTIKIGTEYIKRLQIHTRVVQ